MANPIRTVIRETIDTLYQAASHIKKTIVSGLGLSHKDTVDLFAGKNIVNIPAPPVNAEIFATDKTSYVSLHPKDEQNLRLKYTQRFSHLLNIQSGKATSAEKDIYSLILEVINDFKPENLSPLAIIHFKEALDLQLNKLNRVLIGEPSVEGKKRENKKHQPNFKVMQEQLKTLKEVLHSGSISHAKVEVMFTDEGILLSGIGETEEDKAFAQKVTELALVMQFKAEKSGA